MAIVTSSIRASGSSMRLTLTVGIAKHPLPIGRIINPHGSTHADLDFRPVEKGCDVLDGSLFKEGGLAVSVQAGDRLLHQRGIGVRERRHPENGGAG